MYVFVFFIFVFYRLNSIASLFTVIFFNNENEINVEKEVTDLIQSTFFR